MSNAIKQIRLIALGEEAHRTICGLVGPTGEIDPGEVFASEGAWEEIRSAFPVAEARPGEEAPPPASVAEVERILVLDDGETFSRLEGCRVYEVPAQWGTEEVEDALAGACPSSAPGACGLPAPRSSEASTVAAAPARHRRSPARRRPRAQDGGAR